MATREVVDHARNFAVMVRVQGPDPKGLKMQKHAFHQYHSGRTTLSASGMILPETLYDTRVAKHLGNYKDQFATLVLTVSSIFEPFMPLQHRNTIHKGKPELIPGVQIDIMVEGNSLMERDSDVSKTPHWHAAHLLALYDIPTAASALKPVMDASLDSLHQRWEVGWSLASYKNGSPSFRDSLRGQIENDENTFAGSQRYLDTEGSNKNNDLTIRMAILGVPSFSKDMPNIRLSPSRQRGSFLLAVGSPFGVLSPVHFLNSISVGSISNCYPPNSSKSLLIADMRCLPGMEGCPVFDEHACLIGVLIRPLVHYMTGAEIQLLIPWGAIATACSGLLLGAYDAGKRIDNDNGCISAVGNEAMNKEHKFEGAFCSIQENSSCSRPFPSKIEKAMASVCLVTIGEGIWASGVLLNSQGLVLTNAHLIEPWRFGKANVSGERSIENAKLLQSYTERSLCSMHNGDFGRKKSGNLTQNASKNANILLQNQIEGSKLNFANYGRRNLRVRLNHAEHWIWCDAKVLYICKGPWDVALLQLEQIPEQLSSIIMDFSWPSAGSKIHVIGHGLLGPKSGFSPSVCSGVVANVVKAKIPPSYHQGDSLEYFPAMLETTAAVHPGCSGGAVVNSEGHMIGLVTSNARHGRGAIIPHLNFSIPCAALEPIHWFLRDMKDLSVLKVLDEPDEQLSSIWALMSQRSPKPSPLPDLPQLPGGDHETKGKGSRFAKFIAERREVFRKSTLHNKEEKLPSNVIRSKL
ncbi:glyoxysomal processing protease, glyoxysomal isoform X1 [Cucurbita moschata]|uniref:Glyoxysomal processing protease, glyoxysomal isoform X1 n=3 Tax=Cucurbita moschata TaxID=3662 RepID=A0A6J1EJB5_CUCMO|nr:glyoxysomal processing protease, glyoxysomal isoform X1 [Cucurbita moschata]